MGQEIKEENPSVTLSQNIKKSRSFAKFTNDGQRGWFKGVELSYREFIYNNTTVHKTGLRLSLGNRLNRRWYVGALAGIDMTTPRSLDVTDSSEDGSTINLKRKDKIYIPIMAEGRFYFGEAKFMPYLYYDLGYEFSHISAPFWNFGLGFDCKVAKFKSLLFGFGFGEGRFEFVTRDKVVSAVVVNAKVGFNF